MTYPPISTTLSTEVEYNVEIEFGKDCELDSVASDVDDSGIAVGDTCVDVVFDSSACITWLPVSMKLVEIATHILKLFRYLFINSVLTYW